VRASFGRAYRHGRGRARSALARSRQLKRSTVRTLCGGWKKKELYPDAHGQGQTFLFIEVGSAQAFKSLPPSRGIIELVLRRMVETLLVGMWSITNWFPPGAQRTAENSPG